MMDNKSKATDAKSDKTQKAGDQCAAGATEACPAQPEAAECDKDGSAKSAASGKTTASPQKSGPAPAQQPEKPAATKSKEKQREEQEPKPVVEASLAATGEFSEP